MNDLDKVTKYLENKYEKFTLSKKELANELSISIYTIDKYIVLEKGLPAYRKIGKGKNSKVIFNITSVAKYLVDTIETV